MQFLIGALVVYWILAAIFGDWTGEKIWMGLFAGILFCVWFFLGAVIVGEFLGLTFIEDYVLHGLVCCMIAGQVYVFRAFGRFGL